MKLYASPLQGFTEAPWRNIHHELFGGIDAYYTPFVRVEKGEFRNKDIRDIEKENNKVTCLGSVVILGGLIFANSPLCIHIS